MQKSLMIASFSKSASDPRVMRQVEVLRDRYAVDVAGYGSAPEGIRRFYPIPRHLHVWEKLLDCVAKMLGFRGIALRNRKNTCLIRSLQAQPYDLVIANDLETLPAVFAGRGAAPVLLDAHEYSPRQFEDRFLWRLLFQREQRFIAGHYLQGLAGAFTVCGGIAEEYRREYGMESRVVTNAAPYHDLQPVPVEEGRIRLVHPGTANPSRKLEGMIEIFRHLDDRFTLDFYLMPNHPNYLAHLKKRAKKTSGRIRFRNPVENRELIPELNAYDIGIFLLPPVNFNYAHALPNKFFQFVQARLAVAIGPSLEMAPLAAQHGFGVIADSFDPWDMAVKLNQLTAEDIRRLKHCAHQSAAELADNHNRTRIEETVKKLMSPEEVG